MIGNMQSRSYRCQTMATGLRQDIASGHTKEMSAQLRRAMCIVLGVALFIVLACGQFFHWKIMVSEQVVDQVQVEASTLGTENINLLAKRARLLSPAHVEAMAAVRLGLHAPAKSQVHRL